MRMQYQNLKGFHEHLESLMGRLKASSGVTDLQPMFYRLTLDTTIAMILGEPVESFKHEMGDIFSKAFDKASLVTGTRARLGDLYFLYRPTGFFKACEKDNAHACYNVGIMHKDGHGVRRDRKKAKAFFRKSCRLGHEEGCQ